MLGRTLDTLPNEIHKGVEDKKKKREENLKVNDLVLVLTEK